MKDYIAELVRASRTPLQGRNVTREYLQVRLLGSLQRAGAMIPLAFHGGTALQLLYASPRYSEDLDFALERLERTQEPYDLRAYLNAVRSELTREGYALAIKLNERKTVHSAFVRFPGLLYELGLSPRREEVLAVKIEVDTRPPPGAVLTTTVIRRYLTLQLQHHDRASLLAGKLHALLQRPHLKGRDVYDLLWYLSDPNWPPPNLTLLNNALQQTGWTHGPITAANWREQARLRIQALPWEQVTADVRPMLEPSADAGLLTLENVLRLLRQPVIVQN